MTRETGSCTEVRTAVTHGDDVCTRSIHHGPRIGRDEEAGRGGAADALFNPPPARPEEGKNALQEGIRKRSRAQFLVVVDQSVRRGEATKMYLRKSSTVPGGKPPRHSRRFFTDRRDYCACVV